MHVLLIAAIIQLLIVAGLFLPTLPGKWWWKLLAGIFATLAAFKFQLVRLIGGSYFDPDLPRWVQIGTSWWYACGLFFALMLALFALPRAVAWVMLCWCKKKRPKNWQRWIFLSQAALLALAIIGATWGMFSGLGMPQVRELTLAIPNLPTAAAGLKIVHLSDIHVDRIIAANRVNALKDRINALAPDVVLITGDFVDGRVAEFGQRFLPFKELKARWGVYGVPGNHEYYSGYNEWMECLQASGVRMLENRNVKLSCGVVIAGVTDPAARRFSGMSHPDLAKALADVPENAPVVLMAHNPRLANDASRYPVDLCLSGHTHGGMLPGLRQLVARFNGGYVQGEYPVGERMTLSISNGTGIWGGFPIRIFCPPQITLITLVPGK